MFVFIVFFCLVFVLPVLIKAFGKKGPLAQILALEKRGVRAHGLVLACDRVATGVSLNGRRFEKRTMTLEIEIPGREPYQSRGDFLVPRGLVETVPGTALDLAVDPKQQNQVAVLGPGGFSGPWIRGGPPAPY